MTRMTLLIPAAAAAALLATTAVAQVPGLGGQVGGQVGGSVSGQIGAPRTGPVTDPLGQVVRDGRDLTRETVRDSRRAAREARPDIDAEASASARADARADRRGAEGGLDIVVGGSVRSSDGVDLGSVAGLARNSAGRITSFLVRSADGTVRAVPADGASVQGEAVVTGWTEGEFAAQRPRRER